MLIKLHAPVTGTHGCLNIFHGQLLPLNLGIGGPNPVSILLFLLQKELCVLARLLNQYEEHRQHCRYGNENLNQSPSHHTGADGTDLSADDIILNQYGQHPVRALHRNITEFFLHAPAVEGNLTGSSA